MRHAGQQPEPHDWDRPRLGRLPRDPHQQPVLLILQGFPLGPQCGRHAQRMHPSQLGGPQVAPVVQDRQRPVPLQRIAERPRPHLRTLPQERPRQLQRQREPPQHPRHGAGLAMLRMPRLAHGLPPRMMQEDPQRPLLGQHRDLDRRERADLAPTGREQNPTPQRAGQRPRHHRPTQLGRITQIFDDQQGIRAHPAPRTPRGPAPPATARRPPAAAARPARRNRLPAAPPH